MVTYAVELLNELDAAQKAGKLLPPQLVASVQTVVAKFNILVQAGYCTASGPTKTAWATVAADMAANPGNYHRAST